MGCSALVPMGKRWLRWRNVTSIKRCWPHQQEEGELFGFSLVVELKVPTSSSRNLVLIIGQQLDKEKGQDQVHEREE